MVVVADCKDGDEDAGCDSVAATNSILLSLLTDRLKNIHDIELPLCGHDAAHIIKLICARNSDQTDYDLPSCVPAKFRCYVRILTSSHLVLTVVPATYDDTVAIMAMLDSRGSVVDVAADDATGLNKDKNAVEAVAETVNCGRIPADQDFNMSRNVEETSDDQKYSRSEADAEVDMSTRSVDVAHDETVMTDRPQNIRLPVFVFDCMLHLISDQLVHHSSTVRPTDIVEDFTSPVIALLSKASLCVINFCMSLMQICTISIHSAVMCHVD